MNQKMRNDDHRNPLFGNPWASSSSAGKTGKVLMPLGGNSPGGCPHPWHNSEVN